MAGMTARELAMKLLALPRELQDWEVTTEGCDCDGDAGNIQVREDMHDIFIGRAIEAPGIIDNRPYQPSEVELELRKKGLLP